MGFRRETEGNIHRALNLEVYHHSEQHKIQATRAILGTDPNEQESGVRAMTVGDFLQCLSLILF